MNVGQVRSQGPTGKAVLIQRPVPKDDRSALAQSVDEARVSEGARDALVHAERRARTLRTADPERQRLVEDARARLERGELDAPHVLRETARRMLDSDDTQAR